MPRPIARHRTVLLTLLCLGATAPSKPFAPPKRIVSLNLCTDQLAMTLADRSQIAALTRLARDSEMSAGAVEAQGLPVSRADAEDIVALDPDLVLAAPGQVTGVTAALAGQHYRTLELGPADSYADIVAQIRNVAAAVGHPERGAALIARMDAALAALPPPRSRGVAAYYQRRGYLTGSGTLIDELMHRVGLVNLATRLDKPALSQLSLEELISARPDWLIVESGADRVTDQGTEMLHHPILADIPRLRIPQAWTVCGGPAYVEAARRLSEQLAKAAPAHAQKATRTPP